MSQKKIDFGIMLNGPGSHMHAWKSNEVPSDASTNFEYQLDIAKRAERAGFSFVFVADGLYIHEKSIPHFLDRHEPLTLLAALAPITQKIGLVGTISTSYSEPFTVARQLATIDNISHGRAGWNVVTSPLEGSADNYSKGEHPEHDTRYDIAEEHIQVVQGLWDSYEDDAFKFDTEKGEYLDKNKMHTLDYKGEYFQVKGPLNASRSEQGQPVIFQAGASPKGQDYAAKYADAVFTLGESKESAQRNYESIKDQAKAYGRNPDEVSVYPILAPVIAQTESEAEARFEKIKTLANIDEALDYLGRYYDHHDFSQYDLDAPFPELGEVGQNSFRATADAIANRAKANQSTLREVALEETVRRSPFIGTYEAVADLIIEWVEDGAADGFIFGPHIYGAVYDEFLENVLPILEEKGYYDKTFRGETLRDHLGLPFKENRYTQSTQSRVTN
ncbi:LLM class flavin-dependent oxidoreductase [Staphylococcus pseudoxylosus]|uniref:LLM class flavin-dependent oxidoreductase n=1 Tax=Staphylococcus pseudoxylosus TaxID=2282419 RepID=A0AAQ0MF97_9STAP|nr:LLM class flavin-dependent oxidoreductase [Staphylococcus pseudoxylosus]PTI82032.1 LLM class flavin-dependent oxidoreductase [Staphylococcus xylosus]MBM2657300.1 LLM class flavin-dependent oxidoreductase [Staphylococcus pseudoxylosus]MCE5002760.1 LLM class flavin-dependent oxidoreductase [Staphylococcus pseudoxylosus]MEB5784027.1 LLM class flavin-dependent oxidoreductase [Staphylococcus pseudoxylosus]MEB6333463.1 LLM class flavin-dependent oxidoreductase [Staphylococcus pseudoxylosus]